MRVLAVDANASVASSENKQPTARARSRMAPDERMVDPGYAHRPAW